MDAIRYSGAPFW